MNKITRIFDIFKNFKAFPDTIGKMFFSEKINGNWVKHNTKEYEEVSYELSSGFLELGIEQGDKIATITNNRPQWNYVDMATLQIGGVHVPVYPTISVEEFEYILNHSDTKLVFVSSKLMYEKINPIVNKIKAIKGIYSFDKIEGVPYWKDVCELGKKKLDKNLDKIEKIKESVKEDDLATIIYTSGTTGVPKGVMLSHKNILSNSLASVDRLHLTHGHEVLSFLPLSHVFAHMTSYIYQLKGVSIYYAQSVATVAQDMHDLQVDGFITVPRLLEAIFDKISAKANKLPAVKKKIFNHSIKIAEKYTPFAKMKLAYKMQHNLMDKLVYSQWRKALSSKITFLGSGGSALSPRLARIFWAAGFRVFEGYGLTETSPILSVNYNKPGKVKIGTVGTIMDNVEIKIAEDGEILAKGPNIMLGYYKAPETTAEVFTEDGYFKTGDIGSVDENNFLKITDRKKEIFKLSNGKYIAPQMIENKLKESFLISQAMVIGENEKFPSALISPNFVFFEDWAKEEKIDVKNTQELINLPKVKKEIQIEIKKINKKLGEHEQIRKFQVLCDDFSIKTGELSNTLKLKRKVISEKYKGFIEKIYPKRKNV